MIAVLYVFFPSCLVKLAHLLMGNNYLFHDLNILVFTIFLSVQGESVAAFSS